MERVRRIPGWDQGHGPCPHAGPQTSIGDCNLGREAVQAPWRPLRPLQRRYRWHRKGRGRGRPLAFTHRSGAASPGHLRPQLLNLVWTSSGAWSDHTFIVQTTRIPAQRRGAVSATRVSRQGAPSRPFAIPVDFFSHPLSSLPPNAHQSSALMRRAE